MPINKFHMPSLDKVNHLTNESPRHSPSQTLHCSTSRRKASKCSNPTAAFGNSSTERLNDSKANSIRTYKEDKTQNT